jgi:hypothetical protein
MTIDWNDPAARFCLIAEVGPYRYNDMHAAHRRASIVATVCGHAIRRHVSPLFGRMFMVGDTGRTFRKQKQAEAHACRNPLNQEAA